MVDGWGGGGEDARTALPASPLNVMVGIGIHENWLQATGMHVATKMRKISPASLIIMILFRRRGFRWRWQAIEKSKKVRAGQKLNMDFHWSVVGIKIPRHFQSGKARLSAVLAHVMAIPVDGIGVPLAHVPAQTSVPNAFCLDAS